MSILRIVSKWENIYFIKHLPPPQQHLFLTIYFKTLSGNEVKIERLILIQPQRAVGVDPTPSWIIKAIHLVDSN